MCWNPEVSLTTFLFSVVVLVCMGITLTCTNTPAIDGITKSMYPLFTLFILSFVSMQFIEYKLWLYQGDDPRDRKMNRVWSILAFLLIIVQPLAAILKIPSNHKHIKDILGLYAVFLLLTVLWIVPSRDFRSYRGVDGHLEWKWLKLSGWQYAWLALWVILFFGALYRSKTYLGMAFSFVTLCASIMYYSFGGSWGSMWCWGVNAISIYYLIQIIKS